MRKIKITALLLAVLMVVTAFAGCASKSTVENLDNKVGDLESEIKTQSDALAAIQATLDQLANGGSSDNDKELEEIKDSVAKNEKDVADILAALDKLTDAVEEANKKAEEAGKNETSDDVKKAISQYGALIDDLKGNFEDTKDNYTADSIVAIRKIFGDAQASISTRATADDVKKVYDEMLKALEAYKAVNVKLYEAILPLEGNITAASVDAVKALVEQSEDAIEFYKSATADELVKYVVGEDETTNLLDRVNALKNAQEIDYPAMAAAAAQMVKDIDKIDATYTFAKITGMITEYKKWSKTAEKLSPENVKLVTNYDKLVAAQNSALNAETAKTMFGAETIMSKINGVYAEVFHDYDELVATGKQVVFTFTNSATKIELTSEIYEAIDAKIKAWATEYELTADAVEYIIDTVKGADYYAKYNADKALNAEFEAEYDKFVAANGTFTAIKALNTKTLGADAAEIAANYEANAKAIDDWKKAMIASYKEVLKTVAPRNVNTDAAYLIALTANFNAMTVQAKLGDCDDKGNLVTPYTYGFLANYKADEGANKAYYHLLYDFVKADLASFLATDYKAACDAAEKINTKIKNFATAQATSIRSLVEGIGGYVAFDGTSKLLALTNDQIKAQLAANNGEPKTIAQFVYKYKTTSPYDLSGKIDVETYEAKIAAIEKDIKAAHDAAVALNNGYAEIKGIKITMDTVGKVTAVNTLKTNWLRTGNRINADGSSNMQIATVINTTATGVKEYKLTDVLADCTNIAGATLGDTVLGTSGTIKTMNDTATDLTKQANIVVDAYKMMDKIRALDASQSFGYDNSQNNDVQKNMYNAARGKFNTQGVTSVEVAANPMTEDGTDTSGRKYKKDMYLWTVKYVTFNGTTFTEATYSDYYFTNNKTALSKVKNYDESFTLEQYIATRIARFSAVANADEDLDKNLPKIDSVSIAKDVFVNIPTLVGATTKFSSMGAIKNKVIANYQIAAFALALEAKFMINNNFKAYAKLDDAKKAWDAEDGGYLFNYVKAMALLKTKASAAEGGHALSPNPVDTDGLKNSKNMASVRRAVANIVDTYNAAHVGSEFKSSIAIGNMTIGTDDFDGIVLYFTCDHPDLTASCSDQVCDDCGETIPASIASHTFAAACDPDATCAVCGTANVNPIAHVNAAATQCEVDVTCDVCQKTFQFEHDIDVTWTVTDDAVNTGKYVLTATPSCTRFATSDLTPVTPVVADNNEEILLDNGSYGFKIDSFTVEGIEYQVAAIQTGTGAAGYVIAAFRK